jgi:hypothetical protein
MTTLREPEQRFGELFKAARVLFRERIQDEDQIYATLAFANEVGQGTLVGPEMNSAAWEGDAWERWADSFARTYKNVRAVGVVDGVLLVERVPVFASVVGERDNVTTQMVEVTVFRHSRSPEPERVADAYQQALSDHDVRWDGGKGSISWNATKLRLVIEVRCRVRPECLLCPPPKLIRELYRALRGSSAGDGYARDLSDRKRGRPPEADTLIPACVAFYLRRYGKVEGRKEVHRLLNKYVLPDWKTRLPEKGYSTSDVTQLWADVDNRYKVAQPLLRLADVLLFAD